MNKTILVTGGTKGIGKAIIEYFAAHNFNIITCARSENDLATLQKEMAATFPQIRLYAKTVDLSIKTEVSAFITFVKDLNMDIDVLVNNAGLFVQGQIHSEDDTVLEKLMQVNLYSAYYISKAILPNMMTLKQGHVFNICSTASIIPYINGGAYCVTKFALLGMTKVLREEMKVHGVKVTAVLPGATYTDSWSASDIPPERFMPAEAIAESIFSIYSLKGATNVEEILIRPQLGDL